MTLEREAQTLEDAEPQEAAVAPGTVEIPSPVDSAAVEVPAASAVPPTAPLRYALSVEQYEAMIRAGILTTKDQLELLEGQLYKKMTKNEPHVICSLLFTELLPRLLPAGWLLSFENPVQALQSLPEPDVMIVRGKPRDFLGQRIPADKIGLLVEISDATLVFDRTVKLRIYAGGGVPIYWIVNLNERQIEVFTQPYAQDGEAGYRVREVFTDANTLPFILDGQEIARIPVTDLLP
ncbi:MAG: Uma2 family endonuclease [Anaerolineae bacterium]|nr:Uma2 family endonuclease [Anaerolineae bacterium]NUQ07260.1 Uma2 family endonuclease [Anaerolineae bacterium]